MDELHWDGEIGWAASGSTKHTIIQNPITGIDCINYANGSGTMVVAEVSSSIDSTTLVLIHAYLLTVSEFDNAPADQAYGIDKNGVYIGLTTLDKIDEVIGHSLDDSKSWVRTNGEWNFSVTLSDLQTSSSNQIDHAAGQARLRYITDVPGQQAVYIEKYAQAQAWIANPTGAVPPYVAAEAAAMSTDSTSGANEIIATADQWNNTLSPMIEQHRRASKISVSNAKTNADVIAALNSALQIMNSF